MNTDLKFTNPDLKFTNPYGVEVKTSEVMDEILSFINEDKDREYKIIIGTDAQVHGKRKKKRTIYATVVVCLRVGKGGQFWVSRSTVTENIGIRQRLISEVSKLVEVVLLFQEYGIEDLVDPDNFEIHLDIGHNGRSREVIAECVGWMEGLGFNFKIKPDAWAASNVADHLVR